MNEYYLKSRVIVDRGQKHSNYEKFQLSNLKKGGEWFTSNKIESYHGNIFILPRKREAQKLI